MVIIDLTGAHLNKLIDCVIDIHTAISEVSGAIQRDGSMLGTSYRMFLWSHHSFRLSLSVASAMLARPVYRAS